MYFGEEAWRHPITEFRCPGRAALLLLPAVSCRSRTIRLFLTLKATARAAISGPLQCASSMARWKRLTAGKARYTGMKNFSEKKKFTKFKDWLPQGSVDAARDLHVSIKGPLTTPIGGGIRSLNVALRQIMDLYACIR